jgi:multiple sugar transport system permease protein
MAATTQQRIGWSVANVVTVVLVLIPLVWIISLSFKTPGSITDPTYFPVHWTWANYSGWFRLGRITVWVKRAVIPDVT